MENCKLKSEKKWWNMRSASTKTQLEWYMELTYFTLGLFGKQHCLLALVSFSTLLSINHQNRTSPTEFLTALWASYMKHCSLGRLWASSVSPWHLTLPQQSSILQLPPPRDILVLPVTMPGSAQRWEMGSLPASFLLLNSCMVNPFMELPHYER